MSDARFEDGILHVLDAFTGADLDVADTAGLVNSRDEPRSVARRDGPYGP